MPDDLSLAPMVLKITHGFPDLVLLSRFVLFTPRGGSIARAPLATSVRFAPIHGRVPVDVEEWSHAEVTWWDEPVEEGAEGRTPLSLAWFLRHYTERADPAVLEDGPPTGLEGLAESFELAWSGLDAHAARTKVYRGLVWDVVHELERDLLVLENVVHVLLAGSALRVREVAPGYVAPRTPPGSVFPYVLRPPADAFRQAVLRRAQARRSMLAAGGRT